MPSQFWSISGQKAYCCIAASIALSFGMGTGNSYSSSSLVKAAGTAQYSSYQYFETAISSGVPGQSFQLPKGRYAKIFQGSLTGNPGEDERICHLGVGIPVACETIVVVSVFHFFIDVVILSSQMVKDGFPRPVTVLSSILFRYFLTFSMVEGIIIRAFAVRI